MLILTSSVFLTRYVQFMFVSVYVCIPNTFVQVWARAAGDMMLALQDIGGMMGGVPLMGYTLPKLLPNAVSFAMTYLHVLVMIQAAEQAVRRQVQMKLLRKDVSAEAIGPVSKVSSTLV